MDQAQPPKPTSETEWVALSSAELVGIVRSQAQTIETLTQQLSTLTHQLEWFKRQMFGTKSERLRVLENEKQLALGEVLVSPETPAEPPAAPAAEHLPPLALREDLGFPEGLNFRLAVRRTPR